MCINHKESSFTKKVFDLQNGHDLRFWRNIRANANERHIVSNLSRGITPLNKR